MDYLIVLDYLFSGCLGLAFGSFITMASYRLPRKENWVSKPSRCPICNHRLGVRDLFPVFSWLFSGGKCRYCHTKISVRYPLIELVTGGVFIGAYFLYDRSIVTALLWCVIVLIMIAGIIAIEQCTTKEH